MKPSLRTADYLVIGSGVAGLRAATELADGGRVVVITKDRFSESSTEYAQGGVAVVMSDEDEVGIHYRDTLRAGAGLCRADAVRTLVEEGPDRIMELIAWGAKFDREGGVLAFTREGAHSRRRVLRAKGDSTGREIQRVLVRKVRTFRSITKLDHGFTIDLLVEDGRCTGALIVHRGRLIAYRARAVVLATGGIGQVYSRTTNPGVATGDGVAIAARAGAVIEDMEFVQFHPTSLYVPGAPQFLLSEAMRGEGAVLRNNRGQAFMARYHDDADLAPRDVVSRAILSEMVRTGAKHVFLDLTHLDRRFVRRRFPRIYATCLRFDVDITRELVPVSPAAHYAMGGVKTDLTGQTSVPGLFAAGEVACTGVHGANRLASNSLLEGLVYGARAGKAALADGSARKPPGRRLAGIDVRLEEPGRPHRVEEIRQNIRRLMWEKTGIIRCSTSLSEASDRLRSWEDWRMRTSTDQRELELKNMLTVGGLTTAAALRRENSVGAHYRSDYPEKTPGWRKHLRQKSEGTD